MGAGPWSRDALRVRFEDRQAALPDEWEARVQAHWRRELARAEADGLALFDGDLFQLERADSDSEALDLLLSRTSYRHWHFHRSPPGPLPEPWRPRPLACCAALVSADRKLLLQERSERVAEGAGLLHVPGGHPDPARDLAVGAPDLFGAMEAELREELGLARDDLGEGVLLGLMEAQPEGKPELLFRFPCGLESEALARRAETGRDRYEFRRLLFVEATREGLSAFLRENEQRLALPSRALLRLLAEEA